MVLAALLLVVAAVAWAVSAAVGGSRPRVAATQPATQPAVTGSAARAVDPGRFAPGACQELPPTRGDNHTTVFLDAGHGGIDPGGVGHTLDGTQVNEAEFNLPVELETAAHLRAAGFTVVVSRTGNTTVADIPPSETASGTLSLQAAHDEVAARDICANEAGAQLLVGLYFDAAGNRPPYNGSVTAYDTGRPFSAANQRFATILEHDVVTAMNSRGWDIPDAGAVPDSTLGSVASSPAPSALAAAAAAYQHLLELGPAEPGFFSTPSRMPGAIIEPLFLTTPSEASLAASTTGQQTIAAAAAQAVEQYFAPPPRPAPARTRSG